MSYMIMSYGYEVDDEVIDIETLEEAEHIMHQMVLKWLNKMCMSLKDTDYRKGDHYFCGIVDERGAGIYEIFEVPECKTEYDQLMWDLKLDLEMIEYAATDYMVCLEECMVENFAEEAKRKLARIYEIEHP